MENYRILVINPGSTSTKIAVYDNEVQIFVINIEHDVKDLKNFPDIFDQLDYRKELVMKCLSEQIGRASCRERV